MRKWTFASRAGALQLRRADGVCKHSPTHLHAHSKHRVFPQPLRGHKAKKTPLPVLFAFLGTEFCILRVPTGRVNTSDVCSQGNPKGPVM